MADKSISELTAATQVTDSDLFVLEQGGTAKKYTGYLLRLWLLAMADGHGGIASIAKTTSGGGSGSTANLVDTYTITYADETTSTFDVTNGNGISNISWTTSGTAGNGQTHTGTITYTNGTTSTIVFQDGVKGDTGAATYSSVKYASTTPTSDSDMSDVPNDYVGFYCGATAIASLHYTDYSWYKIKGETGATGVSITGIAKTSTSGDVDTYTISFSNNTSTTFTVTNGSSIDEIELTSSGGGSGTTANLVDTYTITLTDGSTETFEVTNGNGIVSIASLSPTTGVAGTTDTYRITMTNGSTYDINVYNGNDGLGAAGSATPLMDGTAAVGTATAYSREDHVHPSDTSKADLTDLPAPSTDAPQMDGTASYGTGTDYARANHVHPSDTSKANVSDTVTNVTYSNGAIKKTKNGSTTDIVTVDATPTSDSTNPVQSGGVYTGLSGKLNLTGGTLTDTLNVKTSGLTDGVTPTTSSSVFGKYVRWYDSNDSSIGMVVPIFQSSPDTRQGMSFRERRIINGSAKTNSLTLYIDANDRHSVNLSDPSAWIDALTEAEQTDYDTATSSIFVPEADVTITTFRFRRWGRLGMFLLTAKKSNSASGDTKWGTFQTGFYPATRTAVIDSAGKMTKAGYILSSSGTVYTCDAITANTSYSLTATYIIQGTIST